jgi:DNA polymerase III epsilon subunit-like protein
MPPLNPNGRVIVFDLETNGLPESPKFGEYYPPSELHRYRTARVVQWSWALYEPNGTLIREEDHLIIPNTSEFRIMNSEIHGITETMAKTNGKPFETVLALWKDSVDKATTIVGHNVNFDKYVLLSELHRRNFLDEANAMTSDKTWVCTMDRAKSLCGLKARNKLKPPKLRELMHALGIEEERGRTFHNSRDDVYYTAKCYFAEQVLKNPVPKMYEGKYSGKTYEAILNLDRPYAVNAAAVCKVRKLYSSPLRKLSNWVTQQAKTDPVLKGEIAQKETEIRNMNVVNYQS